MQLSIVLLNYNKSHLTVNCLESLYSQYGKEFEDSIFEAIVVDNASEKDEREVLSEKIKLNKYRNLKLVQNNQNAGFSKGCNIGAASAMGKYLLFLNNDTVVKDRGIIGMAEYMEKNSDVSILGGQLKNHNGEKQSSTGKFYTLFNTFLLLAGMQRFGVIDKSPEKISEVDWVKGALLMIRKDVFEKLAGFDEKIFMYMEDMELCYRAKKAGFKTYFYPDVTIIHQDQGSSDRAFAVIQIYKGLLYFYKKHRSLSEYTLVKLMLYLKAGFAIIIGSITGNKYLTSTFRKAIQY